MPSTLDEIARLVHESEELKRKLVRAERRAEAYRDLYHIVRDQRNALQQRLEQTWQT